MLRHMVSLWITYEELPKYFWKQFHHFIFPCYLLSNNSYMCPKKYVQRWSYVKAKSRKNIYISRGPVKWIMIHLDYGIPCSSWKEWSILYVLFWKDIQDILSWKNQVANQSVYYFCKMQLLHICVYMHRKSLKGDLGNC